MELTGLSCQVCLRKHPKVSAFKKHVQSIEHRKQMEELFPNDQLSGHGFFPNIVFINPNSKYDNKTQSIGLCLLNLVYCPATRTYFYLCHVCEEKRPSENILHHLSSRDHCNNYISYMDPNLLSFSWMPSSDTRVFPRPEITKEVKETRNTLQILDMPANLMNKINKGTYSEVMHTLIENEKLLKRLEAIKPMRTMIQEYQRDSNRKHPLLGMQHIVECICVGAYENRYYLCTLCKLTMGIRAIIRHVLSFDHIFSYFKAWHPSTLMAKESYSYSKSFAYTMLNFAKQTEEIHGAANTDMKQVNLEPAEFTSVNFKSYAEALKKLESITKGREGGSLVAIIHPGNKLTFRSKPASVSSSVSTSVSSGVSSGVPSSVPASGPVKGPVKGPVAPSYKLHCLDCSVIFATLSQYLQHVSQLKHKEMLKKVFKEGSYGDQKAPVKLSLDLHSYLQEALKLNQPVAGASLVVACVSSRVQAETIYVCFACQDCFPESSVRQHMKCDKHVIQTLLYQNPWRLPFAWKNYVESLKVLRAVAWEEEKQRGPKQMVVKVLDIPNHIFLSSTPPSYQNAMERLKLHHNLLKKEVPHCETYDKQNGRFPLLGKQFLVKFDQCVIRHHSMEMRFPCLLCERRLSGYEFYAHVFSWEHIKHFLDRFHPGSLTSNTDTETILDLAKQAERIHPISKVQEIKLDKPIREPCTYSTVISILASAKRRNGGGKLEPTITPKNKLFPRETLKKVDEAHVRDNSQNKSWMMEGSDRKTSQKSTDNPENTPKNTSVEPGSGEKKAEGAHKETLTPSDTQSEKSPEVFSQTCPDEVKTAGVETCQWIKQEETDEKMEEVKKADVETSQLIKQEKMDEIMEKVKEIKKEITVELIKEENMEVSIWEITERSQNTDNGDRAETKTNERKRQNSTSEKSQESKCSAEAVGREMEHKRQKLNSNEDSPCEESQTMSSTGLKLETTIIQRESGKLSYETTNDKVSSHENHQQAVQLWQYVKKNNREPVVGLNALLECVCDQHDPIYLCKCCSLKLPEPNIINHVTGLVHQRTYLLGTQKIPPPTRKHQRKKMRRLAASFEQDKGYGEAQVIELDEDVFERISKQSFYSAMQTIKALLAQQDKQHELSLAPALPAAQPEPASVTVHAKLEFYSGMDTLQVIDMDIDSENSETKPSSVTAPMSVMTESTRDASSPQPKRGTNAAGLHCDPRRNNSGDKIAPNTIMERLKALTSLKVGGTPHTATTLDSTPTTPTKSTTAITKCTSISSKCTPDYTKPIATVRKPTATASNCTRAPTTLGETTYKCTAAKSVATATTTKPTTTTVCPATSSKYTAASSTLMGSTSTSNMSISRMVSTTKSTTLTKPMESTPGAATKTAATSCRPLPASQTGSTVVHKTTCVPTHSETASKFTVTPQTTVTNAAVATVTQTSRQFENIKASAKTVHAMNSMLSNVDAAPHIHKSNPPATPTEPSQAFTNKGNKNPPRLGLDEVITVTSGNKKQIYCQLCSVRLNESSHLTSRSHVYQCVKKKYSGFLSDMLESPNNWAMVVANLAELERKCGNRRGQTIEVTDDVYNELRDRLDAKTAIERLNMMLNQAPPPFTDDAPESLRPKLAFPSSCEASSLDDVIDTPQDEKPELLTNNQPQQENTCTLVQVQEKPGHADPCAAYSESACTCAQTPHTHQGTLENRRQQERSDPEMQDTGKTSPVMSPSPDQFSSAPVNTEQQDQSRPSLKAEHVPTPEHEQPSASGVLPSVSVERNQGRSYSSTNVSASEKDTEPIIGLDNVWECRGIFGNLFFLCESCEETLSIHHIFQHLINTDHVVKYMLRSYPHFMLQFWPLKDLAQEIKFKILKDVVTELSKRDFFYKRVLLGPELFEHVRTAPFSEAFHMVTRIKTEEESGVLSLPVSTPQQSDKCLPTRKRPADPPIEALVTDDPQLDDPLPAKHTRSSLAPHRQPSSEPALEYTVNPAATFTPVSGEEKETGPGCDEERTVKWSMLDDLIKLVLQKKSEKKLSPCRSAPGHADATTSTSERGVEGKWASRFEQAEVKMEEKASQWNSQCSWLEASLKDIPRSIESLEGMLSTAPCVDLKSEHQHVIPKVPCVNSLSPRGHSPKGNLLSSATVGTTLPSVNTAPPDELQHQSADAQNMSVNVSKRQPHLTCVAANFNTGQVSQLQSHTTTDTTSVCQLPIKPIITARSDHTHQRPIGGYKKHDHTEVKREIQDAHSLSTDQTANPSITPAAPGGYGHPVSVNFAGCTTPENPSVYPQGLYQHEGLYPGQINPEQESVQMRFQTFGYVFTAPPIPGRLSLDMQQQQWQWQRSSLTSATRSAGFGNVTNDAVNLGAVPFTIPANHSQRLTDLTACSTSGVVPGQSISDIMPRYFYQVYNRPPAFQSPPSSQQ
ncbi:uncharacterized protein LOC117770272 [Hippoglossus hippoglossus]|uniref:uncharacterized protein LOC117770272 n=1 Tax=Hippoglossus hippoglossus TaxID=8267 RepID=UPI00148DD2A4|nr:uncharacterized protein LOC117770272 [Hippoglossus hippoglossus]